MIKIFLKFAFFGGFVSLAGAVCLMRHQEGLISNTQNIVSTTGQVHSGHESVNTQLQFVGMKKFYAINQPVRFVLWNHGPPTNPIQIQLEALTRADGYEYYDGIVADIFDYMAENALSSHFPKITRNAKQSMVWRPNASPKTFLPHLGTTYRFYAGELGPLEGGTAAYYSPPFRFVTAIKTRRHKSKVRSAIGAG